MNGEEFLDDEVMASDDLWRTPTSQPRPRPATIHGGFPFGISEGYTSLVPWNSSAMSIEQAPSDTMSRPISMHQDQYPVEDRKLLNAQALQQTDMALVSWTHKFPDDPLDFQGLETDSTLESAYASDELIPILDLYSDAVPDRESLPLEDTINPRRMSGSSFTMSTSGALSDMPSYEDFSAALSEAQSFSSDYPPTSNRNSLMSSTQLSPVASPRMAPQTRTELVRTQSRGRGQASSSPRPGVRAAPYSVESARNKRWSTGSYGNMPRKPSPFMYHPSPEVFATHQRMSTSHSSPTTASVTLPLSFGNLQQVQQTPFMIPSSIFQPNPMFLPSQVPQVPSQPMCSEATHFETPPPLLSHGLFRMLQSNADPYTLHRPLTDLSDPPDLYASLQEDQTPPPPEDMNPDDPDLVPHEQELRFEGDLYTPKWVRGHGNKREGWCGFCKPGRWLVLKNSAFWYDKSFSHGISAATGNPFQEPQQKRRMDGSPDLWEGLCGTCNEWIALVSSKKKGTTWFRHAYKVTLKQHIEEPTEANCNSVTPIQRSKTFQNGAVRVAIPGHWHFQQWQK